MTIYERPTKSILTDWARDTLKPGHIFAKADVVRWFEQNYPKIKSNTVNMHVEFMSINNHVRKHYPNVKLGSGHDLFYKLDSDEFRLWQKDTDPRPRYKGDFEQQGSNDVEDSATNDELQYGSVVDATGMRKSEQSNIDLLILEFPRYIQIFERNPPFKRYGQWEFHNETIQRRREIGSAIKAIYDEQFLATLYKTLQAWGIGIRASKLRPFEEFTAALRNKSPELIALGDKAIDNPQLNVNETGQQLWQLINSLDVAGTKAVHHLLPDLVVPIDRAYTQRFFGWQTPKFQSEQGACFQQAFTSFAQIARCTNPSQYVGSGWHSSCTKVIDNAIVGFISDQQAAAGKSGIVKAQKATVHSSNNARGSSRIIQSFKQPSNSFIASIVKWCRSLFAARQQ